MERANGLSWYLCDLAHNSSPRMSTSFQPRSRWCWQNRGVSNPWGALWTLFPFPGREGWEIDRRAVCPAGTAREPPSESDLNADPPIVIAIGWRSRRNQLTRKAIIRQ